MRSNMTSRPSHALSTLDLLAHAHILAPENTINFFGFGNESVFNTGTKEGIRYYRSKVQRL